MTRRLRGFGGGQFLALVIGLFGRTHRRSPDVVSLLVERVLPVARRHQVIVREDELIELAARHPRRHERATRSALRVW